MTCKDKLSKFINFLNNNPEIMKELPDKVKINIKELIKVQNTTKDKNIDFYYNVKRHHSEINGKIENEELNKL